MSNNSDYWNSRLIKWTALDPVDRLSEVLFGLIMVLTFTGSISASTAGRQELNQLLWAALGCNFAWGLVDAIMNLMDTLIDRRHDFLQLKKLQDNSTINDSRTIIRDNISPLLSELMSDDEIDKLGEKMRNLPEPEKKIGLTIKDYRIAGEIFLLVFMSTLPVAVPFLFIMDVNLALRVSNGIAVVLMFGAGYYLAKYSGLKPLLTGFVYTALGLFLVAVTMLLGG